MNTINERIEYFERSIINNNPEVERFGMYINEGRLYLSDLSIRNGSRCMGYGSRVMEQVVQFGINEGMDVYCIPSSESDEDERLVRFYGRFGFEVERDYGSSVVSMVRKSGGNNKW